MARSLVDIVEAAYASALSDQAWVEHVATVARPILDQGLGVSVFMFDLGSGQLEVPAMAHIGLPAGFDPIGTAKAGAEFHPQGFAPSPPAILITEYARKAPGALEFIDRTHRPFGVEDVIGVRGADPSRRGCLLAIPLPARQPLPARRRAQLAKLAAHLVSGWRLRLLPESHIGGLDRADAVFDHRGKLEHLAGALDERTDGRKLGAAVERLRSAQKARRLDPDAALELWRALVDGRWSIVATTDTDGKRFLLARRNAPNVRDIKALTRAESLAAAYAALGHSGKLISYELGIAPSSVSALLKGAMRKLGVKSVAELALLFGR